MSSDTLVLAFIVAIFATFIVTVGGAWIWTSLP
jgi:hypothetical protein